MNQDVHDFLVQSLTRMVASSRELVAAHQTFLAGPPSAERLTPLLDQREVSFAEWRDLEAGLATALEDAFPDRPVKGLAAMATLLERELPEGPALIQDLRAALSGVVDSDRAIQGLLDRSKEALDAEIKKIRRGANLLKGYLQPDETGSCFIDKIK